MKTSQALLAALVVSALTAGAHAASYQVVDVKDGGSVTGKVTFSGEDPAPQNYAVTKDPETCGTGTRTIDYVRVNDGALADTVVYLDKIGAGKAFDDKDAKGDLNQEGCAFKPYLQIMHDEQEVSVLNSDPVSHNIHTYEILGRARKTLFNISQPDKGSVIKKKVDLKRGIAMKVECDQHDFMHAFVFVAKNPYYAVVKDDGTFVIDGVPAGEYTVKAWHGTLGEEKTKVTVEAGKAASASFEFKGK